MNVICDMGCCQVAGYLKDHNAEVIGLDLPESMLVEVCRLSPVSPQ